MGIGQVIKGRGKTKSALCPVIGIIVRCQQSEVKGNLVKLSRRETESKLNNGSIYENGRELS